MRTKSVITTLTSAATMGALFVVPGAINAAHADATIDVTTTATGVNPSDGKCSLVEALYAANLDANSAVLSSPPDVSVTTECTAGSGADTITLPAGAVFTVSSPINDLANPFGPTATPIVTTSIVIQGNGARLEDGGGTLMRAFAVDAPGDLTLRDLHVKGFEAKGGAGGDGGGGGLGAGGAVYVRDGSLTIENSTFENNRAEGGNGSTSPGLSGGGGGGGLSGSGGTTSGRADDQFGSIGGGGGGGARGNGGASAATGQIGQVRGGYGGGGGGGTITNGGNYDGTVHTSNLGGEACGGDGAEQSGDNGSSAPCDGGGGGGGGRPVDGIIGFDGGNAGSGGYGGGGGGGGMRNLDNCFFGCIGGGTGGHGGFGGGGGAGGSTASGGAGGFGGGGGGGNSKFADGGTFGGHGGIDDVSNNKPDVGPGGGGAGLGGAVFSDNGTVTIRNSTFTGNSAAHGFAGGDSADDGADAGGAIFAVDGDVTISNSTVSGNADTGISAGVGIYRSTRGGAQASLALTDTIIAGNSPASQECALLVNDDGNLPSGTGSGNLITNNLNCAGVSVTTDPSLKPLAIEAPGKTPTMAIDDSSSAYDAGDDDVCEPADQRGVSRPRSLHCDIGAYEYIKPSANLGVTTTAINNAVAGTDLDFLVDVTNYGPTAAENVTLIDTLPSGTTYVAMPSAHGFTCTPVAATVSCADPLLLEGGEAMLKLTVHVPATAASGSSVTNAASVSSGKTPDPVPGNNASSWTSTVVTRADVSVTKSGPAAPTAGNAVSYTIVVGNDGPSTARTVAMSDTIPAGTTFTSLTSPAGWSCSTPAVNGTGTISCSTATLAPVATATFTVALKLGASATDASQLCNSATVSTVTTDPASANDSSTTCGSVHTLADLAVTQSAATTGKAGKGTATFTATVRNAGPSDSQNVVLTVSSSLFTGPAPSIVTTGNANCSVAGQNVTCTWTAIPTGASRQAAITVPWRSAVGSICATTSVSAGTPDPNAINNKGSVCVGKK